MTDTLIFYSPMKIAFVSYLPEAYNMLHLEIWIYR